MTTNHTSSLAGELRTDGVQGTVRHRLTTLYVDRSSQQWIVRDHEGQFWVLPQGNDDSWRHREPFEPSDETELESVPGHYKYVLGIPR